MKKINQAAFLLSVCLIVAACSATKGGGKKKITEGKIDFSIEYVNLPDEMAQFASMLPNKANMIFKGDLSKVEQSIPMGGKQIVISNASTSESTVLMDMMGRKIRMSMPETEVQKLNEVKAKSKVNLINETKTVAGYECKKAVIDLSNQDIPVTVWYCPKLSNPSMMYNVPGMPLEYDVYQSDIQLRMSADKVFLEPISDIEFNIPDGYDKISEEELKNYFPGN